MYMNKITGMLWVNFSFFIIIISQKSVHKPKKNDTGKKNKSEKLYFVFMGKVPKCGQNFKQYSIYTCNSLEEFSTLG